MNVVDFEVHACKVGGYPVYRCSSCNKQQRGDWCSPQFGGALPTKEELVRTVTPHSMPVGWSSHIDGGLRYKCSACNTDKPQVAKFKCPYKHPEGSVCPYCEDKVTP